MLHFGDPPGADLEDTTVLCGDSGLARIQCLARAETLPSQSSWQSHATRGETNSGLRASTSSLGSTVSVMLHSNTSESHNHSASTHEKSFTHHPSQQHCITPLPSAELGISPASGNWCDGVTVDVLACSLFGEGCSEAHEGQLRSRVIGLACKDCAQDGFTVYRAKANNNVKVLCSSRTKVAVEASSRGGHDDAPELLFAHHIPGSLGKTQPTSVMCIIENISRWHSGTDRRHLCDRVCTTHMHQHDEVPVKAAVTEGCTTFFENKEGVHTSLCRSSC